MIRRLLPLLLLTGCYATPEQYLTGVAAVGIGSIAVIGRSPLDAVYSTLSGRDCSIVRMEQGKSYCRWEDPEPKPPVFCTRSLGVVDCWKDPEKLPGQPTPVAAGPETLTPEQEAYRTRGWLFF
ncbi:MAG: hypothetical protein AB7F35_18020 [Acetobacteraceae bacterium]